MDIGVIGKLAPGKWASQFTSCRIQRTGVAASVAHVWAKLGSSRVSTIFNNPPIKLIATTGNNSNPAKTAHGFS